ncbi:thioredoxin domain-containing protein [Planosporangium thailandense]|uniref:Thioredoxin domain-containing protein n=1 Tax=Planosporangium thailandense TaxID=765197 RepID=A0ABX0Y241_9ACTN|nr:thioredoxin domain-containing protein [Planosporangium thailandense]NJC71498.1 thioredoxin domain-containing protein [Planosporangium thailandense]
MPNRLANATSPYLQQHADNPVDWWEWGPEAFAEARRRDVPVLISVGYAACHWCHVMAHESFDDEGVAAVVNAACVPIKVDREERPDIDAVYMTATQAMTGQGGWPMTVFATPDGEPFFCGTYFPKPNFVRLVQSVSEAWRHNRDAVLRQGSAVVEALGRASGRDLPVGPMSPAVLDSGAASLSREYDAEYAGFGGAPKFPPHMNLLFLLRHHQRTGSAQALEMVRGTCAAMARGGIYDQLGGGFARYSVDRTWTVPHFEKMLYDNALLLRVYAHLWRLTGDELALRVARETTDFLLAELRTSEGGFASSLDADTDGVEGLTYVWTPAQLIDALGEDDGAWAAEVFNVTPEGTFEHGTSVLRLPADPDDPQRFERIRARLREARAERPQPARDDKIVAAWNGLTVTALAEYLAIARDRESNALAVESALEQAGNALAGHIVDGRLRRVSLAGAVGEPVGVLEDYGAVAEAFCALHEYTGEGRWLELAGQLVDHALEHFGDGSGGFYDTADYAERLVTRPADPTDNATPSGASAIAAALTAYSALTGDKRYRDAAELALTKIAALAAQHARFAGYSCAVGEALLSGPYEIAIAGTVADAEPLVAAAWRAAPPGAVIVAGEPDAPGVPLLAGRPLRDGRATAYVCRGFVCDAPVTTVEELVGKLS